MCEAYLSMGNTNVSSNLLTVHGTSNSYEYRIIYACIDFALLATTNVAFVHAWIQGYFLSRLLYICLKSENLFSEKILVKFRLIPVIDV